MTEAPMNETLREKVTEAVVYLLAQDLDRTIANLAYPVGMGVGIGPEKSEKAARNIMARISDATLDVLSRTPAGEGVSPPPASDEAVERAARTIYDATTRFDGDHVGTHLSRSYIVDGSAHDVASLRSIVMSMCEDAAQALASAGLLYPGLSKERP